MSASEAAQLAACFRKMGLEAGAATLLSFFGDMARDDDCELLSRIAVPTLLVGSVRGQEVPVGVAQYMRERIPRAQLVEIGGADHFVFATHAEFVSSVVADFATTPDVANTASRLQRVDQEHGHAG